MKKSIFGALLAATVLFTAQPAMANPYVIVDGGHAVQSGLDKDDSAGSAGVTFGTTVHPNWALETSYKHLGTRKLDDIKFDWTAFSFAVVGHAPVNSSVTLIGKAGVAHTSLASSLSDAGLSTNLGLSKTTAVLGAGVEYRINRDWAVRGMFESYPDFAGSEEALNNVSVGVKYEF